MRAWVTIVILLAWFCLAMPAHAEKRLALVIGNDSYQHIDKLLKAKADAKGYADLLFTVIFEKARYEYPRT
jgi:hypothetical protein